MPDESLSCLWLSVRCQCGALSAARLLLLARGRGRVSSKAPMNLEVQPQRPSTVPVKDHYDTFHACMRKFESAHHLSLGLFSVPLQYDVLRIYLRLRPVRRSGTCTAEQCSETRAEDFFLMQALEDVKAALAQSFTYFNCIYS